MAEDNLTTGIEADNWEQENAAIRKMARAAYMREYRKKNPEKQRALDKVLEARKRAKDPEKFLASAKERSRRYRERKKEQGIPDEQLEAKREANRERNAKYRDKKRNDPEYKARRAATTRKLYAANPQKVLDAIHRRRAKIEEGSVTKEQWEGILARYGHRCAYCRRGDVELGQDHVLPLTKGGTHDPTNVVPCCRPCNTRKGNRPRPFPIPPTE